MYYLNQYYTDKYLKHDRCVMNKLRASKWLPKDFHNSGDRQFYAQECCAYDRRAVHMTCVISHSLYVCLLIDYLHRVLLQGSCYTFFNKGHEYQISNLE